MRVDLFDFDLPPERIALRPIIPRDAARMLVVAPASPEPLQDRTIRDLPDFLRPGDILVVNNTRVIPARLEGVRTRGVNKAKIEVLLHRRVSDDTWRAFAKGAKKLQRGDTIAFQRGDTIVATEVLENFGEGEVMLAFPLGGADLDRAIEALGAMPLPLYIAGKRPADAQDSDDYQSLFAVHRGAVAAPTASLHFTPALKTAIAARGVEIAQITLHVGAGTFLPVKADDTQAHRMHAEWGEIDAETAARLNAARAAGGRIVAVGTTSLRLLESAATAAGKIAPFSDETAIFITPGYRFKAVDLLLTNFHLPRSTLFMLVAAFSGLETMQAAYKHAIASDYRFYSYGDACLLHPAP
ncbi:tRNA preQ1(34) S-adenosylmethionine ribosyltransferase-isomerase QueA [Methylovirgula ligni]|uniref:S-adenosylmethionine:tRNA ribosyltransferase-isomerase n=1 Tax=Methylovirgula ligni TaxID=569860 RepID=A0A3D9YZL0_9HYPH|nr:tRNA preQ1(34) S-adenosylmethionine ribosyltransferase-isomerase QueA [Methylovirgula ligni]QAY96915.1 tRNA preQ1(34) S-adenosylmethionine ribosyltransferase-isomerase QueA [Methylovirgula ligni]REF88031.1 S-adenosylmethionine:tRNA ribosyltransferase-isomerase [Methylovirgula ligni]